MNSKEKQICIKMEETFFSFLKIFRLSMENGENMEMKLNSVKWKKNCHFDDELWNFEYRWGFFRTFFFSLVEWKQVSSFFIEDYVSFLRLAFMKLFMIIFFLWYIFMMHLWQVQWYIWYNPSRWIPTLH